MACHARARHGTVTSVTATDTSIVVSGTPTAAPTLATGTLDVIATQHPPAGNWSNNSHKITSLANGSGAQDAAAYGQTPAGGTTVTIGQGGTGSTSRTFAGLLTPTAVKTTTYSASAGDFVPCDTTSGSFTVTLPNAPADLSVVGVKQVIQGGTNTVTVACAGSDVFNKTGGGTSGTLTLLAQGMLLQYKSSLGVWYVMSDDLPLSQLDLRYLALTGRDAHRVTGGRRGARHDPYMLTDASTIAVNAALSDYFRVTLGGNRTLGTPSNPADGQQVTCRADPAWHPAARTRCPTAAPTPSPRRCRSPPCPPPRTIMTSSASSTTRP